MLRRSNCRKIKKYYVLLASAGSFWGRETVKAILKANNEIEFENAIKLIKISRGNWVAKKEKKENLKTYDLGVLEKLGQLPFVPIFGVPIVSAVFSVPLFLIIPNDERPIGPAPGSEPFVVTEEILEKTKPVLPPTIPPSALSTKPTNEATTQPTVDDLPPAAPSRLRIGP